MSLFGSCWLLFGQVLGLLSSKIHLLVCNLFCSKHSPHMSLRVQTWASLGWKADPTSSTQARFGPVSEPRFRSDGHISIVLIPSARFRVVLNQIWLGLKSQDHLMPLHPRCYDNVFHILNPFQPARLFLEDNLLLSNSHCKLWFPPWPGKSNHKQPKTIWPWSIYFLQQCSGNRPHLPTFFFFTLLSPLALQESDSHSWQEACQQTEGESLRAAQRLQPGTDISMHRTYKAYVHITPCVCIVYTTGNFINKSYVAMATTYRSAC